MYWLAVIWDTASTIWLGSTLPATSRVATSSMSRAPFETSAKASKPTVASVSAASHMS